MAHNFKSTFTKGLALLLGCVIMTSYSNAEGIMDAESSTHGFEAAEYQVVDTYEFTGFELVQIDLAVLSHYSYMLISDGKALVIDPGRDIDTYLKLAKDKNAEIIGVWLSHSHADFVAGHIEFASQLNVPLRISAKANAGYEHIALHEGDSLQVGGAILKFTETPGHTLDSMCAIVANAKQPDEPLALLTGDTLFIGSVGRPDLMGGQISASSLASMMFDTWTNKLSKLPDTVQIFPAHGAGSLCGAHLSDEPVSTIGQQRKNNAYLQYNSRGEFIAAILDGLPEAPQYFVHNAALNQQGPPLVEWMLSELPFIEAKEELSDPAQYFVVDVRDSKAYAEGHIPKSVNIALRGRFETWTGIMVPWDATMVITGEKEDIEEAIHRLHRVGYNPRVLIIDDWKQAGLPMTTSPMVPPKQLHEQMQLQESPVVVDVRLPKEWMAMRIGTVLNIPLNVLPEESSKLDKSQPVVTVCNSAYRSSMAVGIMEREGFENAASIEGGAEAWIEEGLPVFETSTVGQTHAQPVREIDLPERMAPAALKRQLMDLPGTFDLVDLRPSAHFDDYNIPQSRNVDIADLLHNPTFLTGAGPLIIICRDGSLSAMVAGILSQKTQRSIKVLHGGVEAYWSESDSRDGVSPSPPKAATPVPTSESGTDSPKPPIVPPSKKKAGC